MKSAGYIILGYNKERDEYVGYVEHSFSMGIDHNRVRVDRAFESNIMVKKLDKSARFIEHTYSKEAADKLNTRKSYPDYIFSVYRIGSKNCPVTIDWREVVDMKKKVIKRSKYEWRNLAFKVK
jgi:hypothetical protein